MVSELVVCQRILEASDDVLVRYKLTVCKPLDRRVAATIADVFRKQARIANRMLLSTEDRGTLSAAVLRSALKTAIDATAADLFIALMTIEPALRFGADAVRSALPEQTAVEALPPRDIITRRRRNFTSPTGVPF